MSTLRLLLKPTLFTAGVCGTCFCGAAIIQHENRSSYRFIKRHMQQRSTPEWILSIQKQRSEFTLKLISYRKRINAWFNRLSTGEKIAGTTIFINLIILGAWQSTRLQPVMRRFFLSQVSNNKILLSPMILSCFSHSMPLHFAFNMYALYSFSNFANALLGPEQLIGLFISAGVASSLASIVHRLVTCRTTPSLGASGAILGVIAYICITRPSAELLLFFIPISAGNAIKGIMLVDFIGILARWKIIDHAAHLGGSLFGVWYAYYGEKLFYRHRRAIVEQWQKFRTPIE